MGAFMKYRRIFQMILVCITGILLSGCRGQIEEQKKKKQDTHQDSTIQIYKTVGNVSQGIESWWFKRNEEHQQPEVSFLFLSLLFSYFLNFLYNFVFLYNSTFDLVIYFPNS